MVFVYDVIVFQVGEFVAKFLKCKSQKERKHSLDDISSKTSKPTKDSEEVCVCINYADYLTL